MNITDTYPITYNKPVKTDAIDANKVIRVATPEELQNYTITKNFDRYVQIEKENPLDLDQFFMKVDQMRAKVTGIKASSKESGSAQKKTGSN